MEIKLEPVVKKYYDSLEEGKVLGRKCPVCGNVEWPPVYACNACGSYVTEWYEMSQKGEIVELYLPTALSSKPEYKDLEPYAYGLIKVEEGPEHDVMVLNVTRQNAEWIYAHLPYPVHMQIVQRDGYKTCIFAIDPIDGEGNPIPEPVRENPFAAPSVEEEKAETLEDAGGKSNSDILERIIRLAAESYGKDPDTLSAATSFKDDLNAKSVVFVGFAAKIEDEFDILIPMTDAFASKTLGGLADLVEQEIKKQQ